MNFTIRRQPSPEDVAVFADLKSPRRDGFFIAESEKIVIRLLSSKIEIDSLFLTEEYFQKNRSLLESHRQDTNAIVFIGDEGEMSRIVGFNLHQGILAHAKIPESIALDEYLTTLQQRALFVILDEVADAENMGAICRTALALNASALIIDSKSINPWSRRAVRVSMGAVFELPIIFVNSLRDSIAFLRDKGIKTYATVLSESATPIWECDLTQATAIVFGSEGHGIKDEIILNCDEKITIPMRDTIFSLNVSTAQAIVLSEVSRQRIAKY
ncbi:MAG: RNA methyltransferase [bacterium]